MYILLNRNHSTRATTDPLFSEETNGNNGNYYISYCVEKMLGLTDENTLFINSPGRGLAKDLHRFREELPLVSHVILILQDYLRETYNTDPDGEDQWYDSVSRYIELLGNPRRPKLVVMSLSANATAPFPEPFDTQIFEKLSPIKRRLFNLLGEYADSIGVRDHYTQSILESAGFDNVVAVGCPSNFLRGPGRTLRFRGDSMDCPSIGVTGELIKQVPFKAEKYLQSRVDSPLFYGAPLDDKRYHNNHFFMDPEQWMNHIQEHCYCMIGTRYHGSIVAMNAGVPAIVTNSDMRTKGACEFMGVPWMPGEPREMTRLHIQDLFESLDYEFINARYQERYAGFAAWCESFELPLLQRS